MRSAGTRRPTWRRTRGYGWRVTSPRSADRAEAKAVLAEATERAEELGAGLLIDRLQTLARQLGLASSRRRASAGSAFADLTPRELEVLRLVAEGRTNGEIGAALFISTKTASVHVSNIFAKLGVSGRGEAAAIAHRHGLVGRVIARRPGGTWNRSLSLTRYRALPRRSLWPRNADSANVIPSRDLEAKHERLKATGATRWAQ